MTFWLVNWRLLHQSKYQVAMLPCQHARDPTPEHLFGFFFKSILEAFKVSALYENKFKFNTAPKFQISKDHGCSFNNFLLEVSSNCIRHIHTHIFVCRKSSHFIKFFTNFWVLTFSKIFRILKVRKYQNEFMQLSHCPKYEGEKKKIMPYTSGQNFSFIFWSMWRLHT